MSQPNVGPELASGLARGHDGNARCFWGAGDRDYTAYHDHEWGVPTDNDLTLFEKICLEGFQSGLSWLTILRKRDNFREAFDGFDFERVAEFTEADVERLLGNAGMEMPASCDIAGRFAPQSTTPNGLASWPPRKVR